MLTTVRFFPRDEVVEVNVGPQTSKPSIKTIYQVVGFAFVSFGRSSLEAKIGIPPGIYYDRSKVRIQQKGKGENGEVFTRKVWALDFVNQKEGEKRVKFYRGIMLKSNNLDNYRKIVAKEDYFSELPETPFREGDVVRIADPSFVFQKTPENNTKMPFVICEIEYLRLKEKIVIDETGDFVFFHAYRVKGMDGVEESCREDQLELIERGKYW